MKDVPTEGKLTLMRVYVGESDTWQGKPLSGALVDLMRHEGMNGISVLRGGGSPPSEGRSQENHATNLLLLSQELPVVVEVVETEERIEKLLSRIGEMIPAGRVITLERALLILCPSHG
jgi:PII-like signaling protein